ncbi:putative dihydrofolate synthetase [Penicillium rolfsii]|nr:putative dihydrofolate synthetase [Penicillium rolfsii]
MIELGLNRVARLLQQTPLTWKAIHIAGTNGKGSISAYLSHLLSTTGVRCGRFTSPHLIDRWDCITIGERVVQESLFRQIESQVKQRDQKLGIGASEFELLTATAFEIFNHEQVEVGVVEVGMGGRLDATNILTDVLVSVIAKIGMDHQAFLGSTIEEIAREKGGILKPGVPCVIDNTNETAVIETLSSRVQELGIDALLVSPDKADEQLPPLAQLFRTLDLEPHQQENMCCAVSALRLALSKIRPQVDAFSLLPHLSDVRWPGRLENINLQPLIERTEPVLLDGAHNPQSAAVLGRYIDRKLRPTSEKVTWVIAASSGKDLAGVFCSIIRPGDNVATAEFGPVDGMPWVTPTKATELASTIRSIPEIGQVESFEGDLLPSIQWASQIAQGGPMVIAGSLYLVSDVHRLLRDVRQ